MNVEQIVSRLAEASDAELAEALTFISSEAASLADADATEENVTKLESYAAARAAIAEEQGRRAGLADRAATARAALTEEPQPPAPQVPEPPADQPPADPGEQQPGEQTEDDDDEDDEGDSVTAAGKRAKLGSIGRKPGTQVAVLPKVTATTVSLSDSPAAPAGTQLDRWKLADAMLEKHNRVTRSTVQGRQYVARIQFDYPEERILRHDAGAHVNSTKINEVTESAQKVGESLTAAGLCAPLETLYDINVCGVTDRPVRDALARFQVDRGGIQYRMPMDALAMTDGLGIWTVEMDEAVGVVETPTDVPDPVKTCAIIDCPDVVDAVVYSTYLCLQYPNFSARFDREWVDATTRAAMIAWARFAENQLLQRLMAGSKVLDYAGQVSTTRDILAALDRVVAYYRNRHRLDTMVPLRMILPRWVLDAIRADLVKGFPGGLDAFDVADARIMGWFRARGVNVTFHLDGNAGATVNGVVIPNQFYADAAAGADVPAFPAQIDAVLFAEGDWLFLDGGTLDLGIVRDSTLNQINRYQQFVENFEGVAFNGCESLRLVLPVNSNGAVVGTVAPAAIVDAS